MVARRGAPRGPMTGLALIDRNIRTIRGIGQNINARVQETAVLIVEHAAKGGVGGGNGDVSRALLLCQALPNTFNRNYLVGWFAAFAGTNVNLKKGTVNLFSKDSKKQRGFRVDEAKANNWFEAIDKNGERAPWYAGPEPEDYVPEGLGDVAEDIQNMVTRMNKKLAGTKTVKGKEVPLVSLTAEEEQQVHNALNFINQLAATLARREDVAAKKAMLDEAIAASEQDEEILEIIQPKEEAVA